MLPQANIKRVFQLSLITIFTTLIFLGTAGVNTALADHDEMEGRLIIKQSCFNGANPPIVTKIKSDFQMSVNPTGTNQLSENGGITPFPSLSTVDFFVSDFNGTNIPEDFDSDKGVALSKNLKKGIFQTFAQNSTADRVLSLNGVIVVDKDGNTRKISGKIDGYDATNECFYEGTFKGKRCRDNECPDV